MPLGGPEFCGGKQEAGSQWERRHGPGCCEICGASLPSHSPLEGGEFGPTRRSEYYRMPWDCETCRPRPHLCEGCEQVGTDLPGGLPSWGW